jgi:hypothetical protein
MMSPADPPTDAGATPGQMAMAVDATFLVTIEERRQGGGELTVGPLEEETARALTALLLGRLDPPHGPGPWRCAVAGGSRTVTMTQVS